MRLEFDIYNYFYDLFTVLGIATPPVYSPPTLFQFVARFAGVGIEDSSRNRFAAYFAQSQTMLFPCILFIGGMFRGGTFRGGIFGSPYLLHKLALSYLYEVGI